jgi:F-type H+-transporting ATPase subunit alpha
VSERLDTADKLSDEDRETIIDIARKALAPFHPKPEPELQPEVQAEVEPKPKPEPEEES